MAIRAPDGANKSYIQKCQYKEAFHRLSYFFYFGTKMGRNTKETFMCVGCWKSRIEGQLSEEIVRANLKTNKLNIQEDTREICHPLTM